MSAKRVLVTGSSRGIGKAIALRLAADGWSVAVHSSGSGSLAAVKAELGDALAGAYEVDLTEMGSGKVLWEQALADGPIHALVNNAGVYRPVSFVDATDEEFSASVGQNFGVNLRAPFELIRAASLTFAQSGGGKILNVASRVGFKGEGGAAAYAASKAALINLTRSLAVELAPRGIRLFGIAPGWVETAMVRDGMEERLPSILETIPLGRMATPEDCAHASSFLLSDGSDYLSGVVIDINGASYFH